MFIFCLFVYAVAAFGVLKMCWRFAWMGRFGLFLLIVEFGSKFHNYNRDINSSKQLTHLFIGLSKFRKHICIHSFLLVILLLNFLFTECDLVSSSFVLWLEFLHLKDWKNQLWIECIDFLELIFSKGVDLNTFAKSSRAPTGSPNSKRLVPRR